MKIEICMNIAASVSRDLHLAMCDGTVSQLQLIWICVVNPMYIKIVTQVLLSTCSWMGYYFLKHPISLPQLQYKHLQASPFFPPAVNLLSWQDACYCESNYGFKKKITHV